MMRVRAAPFVVSSAIALLFSAAACDLVDFAAPEEMKMPEELPAPEEMPAPEALPLPEAPPEAGIPPISPFKSLELTKQYGVFDCDPDKTVQFAVITRHEDDTITVKMSTRDRVYHEQTHRYTCEFGGLPNDCETEWPERALTPTERTTLFDVLAALEEHVVPGDPPTDFGYGEPCHARVIVLNGKKYVGTYPNFNDHVTLTNASFDAILAMLDSFRP